MQELTRLVNYLTSFEKQNDFKSETLLVAGNSIPDLIAEAAAFCRENGTIRTILFSGGIGHATGRLIENIRLQVPNFKPVKDWEKSSEAELMAELFLFFNGPSSEISILLEKHSTNTGENARFSRQLLEKNLPNHIWLVQDPLLQKRTMYTIAKEWALPLHAIRPIPMTMPRLLSYSAEGPRFQDARMNEWWAKDYFLSLAIGEVRRLIDDSDGYGPNGAGFIPHVEIPKSVIADYHMCKQLLGKDVRA
ncbi:hypothetical protein NRIC_05000 [Enterococcus florum]|uniref:DUF218 domain-containing protein n=1 Tax=Enterococcus florum TaxID=2480627 RepID=A0A4V0WP48_9ENTE|nr:YdcF family protein [Enterococcus florum]GCF92609.1 hypothetical protein NRIC_05000 [Enterococcus florum]